MPTFMNSGSIVKPPLGINRPKVEFMSYYDADSNDLSSLDGSRLDELSTDMNSYLNIDDKKSS